MLIQSQYPAVKISSRSITELILERARQRPDRPAFIDGESGRSLTFGQFANSVERTAAGLVARGLLPGDVCVLHSPNCVEWGVAYHAVLLAGGSVSPTSPMLTPREIASQARDAGAAWMIVSQHVLAPALQAAREADVTRIIAFGGPDSHPEGAGVIAFDELATESTNAPLPQLDPNDVAVIAYSSGTTGLPKGVMLTQRNLTACAQILEQTATFDGSGTMLAVIPICHISGIMAFMHLAPLVGQTVVVLPRFDLEQFLQTIERWRTTALIAAPPLVLALARHPLVASYDLSSLETVLSAAAPLKENLARACMERIGCEIIQGYGMTECMAVTVGPRGADRPGSAGVPIANTEFRIVDIETGIELGENQPGEVWVRGPQVMKGYLNRPEATADLITVDGWLKTGDIGLFDADGYLYIVDRLKELIKYNAYQVSPAELEDLLVTHPAIIDAAVIRRPDEEAGELPIAYVVTSAPVAADEIVAYVAERVAPFKKIRGVEFVDAIPKSPAGKILRRELIERERGALVV
jgi:acyl-CoA synthetase (AMP-forming)/AMP-acid ligase II